MCSFEGRKYIESNGLFVVIFIVLKSKRKKFEVFLTSTKEQVMDCVHHTRGFI